MSVDVQAKDTLTRFCCLSPQNPEGFRLLCELLRSRPAGDERDAELLTAAMHLARVDPWSEEARESLRELNRLPEGCATEGAEMGGGDHLPYHVHYDSQ